jgi:hypothetical protein
MRLSAGLDAHRRDCPKPNRSVTAFSWLPRLWVWVGPGNQPVVPIKQDFTHRTGAGVKSRDASVVQPAR